jgi:hypothetical protein
LDWLRWLSTRGRLGRLRWRRETTTCGSTPRPGRDGPGDHGRWAARGRCDDLGPGGVQRIDLGREIGEAIVDGGDEVGDVWHAPRV